MPTKAKNESKYEPQGFAKAPVKRGDKGEIFIELPASLENELEVGSEVFFTMTSGVLQISAKEPQLAIPVINVTEDFTTPRV